MNFSRSIVLAGQSIGPGHPCFVIGEAGVSHFGDYDKALELIDLAVEARADAIKFQIFDVDSMISKEASEWKTRMGGRSLSYDQYADLKGYCSGAGILFFATAHDEPSLDFLAQLDVPLFKIGSGELNNWDYIEKVAVTRKPTILSTGMATLEDVGKTLNIFRKFESPDLALLHCVTSYPTLPSEVNLRAMSLLREKYQIITGYSDHTTGYHIPLAAVALGADIVEKHLSLEFGVEDAQDWKVSCGKDNFRDFISELRDVERSLGKPEKTPTPTEIENMKWALKSLVFSQAVVAGQKITREILTSKRPGTGIPPNQIDKVIGREILQGQEQDSLVRWENIG